MPTSPPETPEALTEQFIRFALAGQWQANARQRAEALAPRLDWTMVRHVAAAERLSPLLYQAVGLNPFVPAAVAAGWRRAYARTAQRNLYLLHILKLLLAGLEADHVPAVTLKGAALIAGPYGDNIALRPLRDIDLLIHPADLPRALNILQAQGYQAVGLETQPGAAAAFESQRRLRKPGMVETLVEIHWSLFDSPYYRQRLSLGWMWQTARLGQSGELSCLVPGPEAHLLYLCGHVWLHHQGAGLLWRHDIAALIHAAGPGLNWPEILRQAQAWDLVLPLQRVLPAVANDYGMTHLGGVLEELDQLRPSRGERANFDRLTAEQRSVASRFWADLSATAGWGGRLGFAAANLFPSQSYMRLRYRIAHPAWLFLYYPYRWFLGARSALWKRK